MGLQMMNGNQSNILETGKLREIIKHLFCLIRIVPLGNHIMHKEKHLIKLFQLITENKIPELEYHHFQPLMNWMIKAFTSTVANIITKEIRRGKNWGGAGRGGKGRGEERENQTEKKMRHYVSPKEKNTTTTRFAKGVKPIKPLEPAASLQKVSKQRNILNRIAL